MPSWNLRERDVSKKPFRKGLFFGVILVFFTCTQVLFGVLYVLSSVYERRVPVHKCSRSDSPVSRQLTIGPIRVV